MEQRSRTLTHRFFFVAFLVLTWFCWCPLGYGSYGESTRFLGIPSWSAMAYVFGVVLFCLEWVYLFCTGLAVTDQELADIVAELEKADARAPVSEKEGT